MYKIKVVAYFEYDVDPAELMPISEAARELGMSMAGVVRAMERGELKEIIDEEALYHRKRLVLRSEVAKFKRKRAVRELAMDEE